MMNLFLLMMKTFLLQVNKDKLMMKMFLLTANKHLLAVKKNQSFFVLFRSLHCKFTHTTNSVVYTIG